MKAMTPHQVYVEVRRRAKIRKKSLRAYCAERGINHSTVCKWRGRRNGSVFSDTQARLLNDPAKRKPRKK
jgi:hypothetical protein